jgi:hypothetical protein
MSAAGLWSYERTTKYCTSHEQPRARHTSRRVGGRPNASAGDRRRRNALRASRRDAARIACGPRRRGLLASLSKKSRARGAKPTHRQPEAAAAPPAIHRTKAPQPQPPKSAEAPMGQTASSHNDAPPPPSIPLTPRCGRAVRQVNDVLERGGWRVFESCDDDFTGVVSIQEIRAKFVEVLRGSTTASSLSLPALNAFLACCDRGDGFVDHGGWQSRKQKKLIATESQKTAILSKVCKNLNLPQDIEQKIIEQSRGKIHPKLKKEIILYNELSNVLCIKNMTTVQKKNMLKFFKMLNVNHKKGFVL